MYGAEVSKDTISRITDRVLEEMAAWQTRPLDPVYPVVFIDAIRVKIRDGKVANRPVYTVVGVTLEGERDILGLWAGDGSEGAKYWHRVLSEILSRGVQDVCIVVCDGLKGLPEAINSVWPQAIVQTCVLHPDQKHLPLRDLYLTIRSLDPRGHGRARWITRWKPALNAFTVTFEDRIEINN